MKTKLVLLAAAIALSHTAYADDSSTTVTTSPASAETTNANIAQDSTASDATGVRPGIKYVGIVNGPGLQFSGARQATNKGANPTDSTDYSQMVVDNRPKLMAKFNANTEVGFEPRFNTFFGSGVQGDNVHVTAGNMRLFANFKHVYKDDIYDLSLTPRLFLPTGTKYRNQKTTVSPDMIADFTITPKNTRFTFDLGLEYIHLFHTDGANAKDSNAALTGIFVPWLEVDYQLSTKTQLMISYWPELVSEARQGTPLHTDSNEIDIGAYYEFAKGWQVNPYIMAQPLGMDTGSPLANLQLNLLFVGTIL